MKAKRRGSSDPFGHVGLQASIPHRRQRDIREVPLETGDIQDIETSDVGQSRTPAVKAPEVFLQQAAAIAAGPRPDQTSNQAKRLEGT